MAELAEVTGFTVKRPVAFELITRAQVNQFLQDRIKESVKPAELRAEELTLKKLGFVPQDFDLKKTTIELLTEQTAAFYDFHRKKLYITEWAATALRDEALVHELAHALADQNFPLEKFSKKVENDSEQSLSRQAVVEGQASWLMREVLLKRAEKGEIGDTGGPAKGDESFPVFDKAPLYFQETLMFPYNAGEEFQKAINERMGKRGYAQVFLHPPVSAQQVLHPDLYFAGLKPLDPAVPEVKGMKRLVEGSLGELEHSILLRQYCGEETARDLSPKWRGANYRLYEGKKDKRVVMVYRSAWADPEAALRYFAAYEAVLHKKWKTMEVETRAKGEIAGKGDDGYFRLALEGPEVTSWEGFGEKP